MTEDRLRTFAKAMRREPTDAEYALWQLLRGHRLKGLKFRRQVPLGPYIADFVCHARKLIVEVDGSQHIGSKRDAARDLYFEAQGYLTLRFENDEVLEDEDAVASRIKEEAGRRQAR